MSDRQRTVTGQFTKIHGGAHTRLYNVWCCMRERCKNPHNKRYDRYGGRGIKVCSEWDHDFAAFRDWSNANGYQEGLTIDRIDCDGNYEPGNCRWVTHKVQNRNYSRNHFITYHGETKCIADWADETGINRATILFRMKQGKPLEEVFSKVDGRATRWMKQRQIISQS